MDDDSWSFGFSTSSKSYRSALLSRPGELRIGFLYAVWLMRKKKGEEREREGNRTKFSLLLYLCCCGFRQNRKAASAEKTCFLVTSNN